MKYETNASIKSKRFIKKLYQVIHAKYGKINERDQ